MTIEAVVVALAAFAIGFSKVGIGGGLGPLITAVMALVFDPQVALAILLPILIVGDAFSMAALWGKWGMAETLALRSEERRAGKEWGSRWRSGGQTIQQNRKPRTTES